MKRIAFATILIVIATVTSGWLTRQVAAAPGDIDPSFGLGGRVSFTNFAGRETAIQPDGKTLAAGSGSDGPNLKFNLMRFNPDGSPDVTFGTGGKAYTTNDGIELGANAVAIQPDGKIITAGNGDYYDNQGGGVVFGIGLARYNLDGSTDNNFGTGGKVFAAFDEADAHAVAVQSDGKIVVAGYTRYPTWGFLVLRYEVNGTPDLSFGVGGQVVTSFGGTADQARDVKLQADGKIVVAGVNGNGAFPNSTYNFALARYNPDGSLDSFFGDGGKIVTPFDDNFGANALALQADGKIVAVGGSGSDYHHGTALTRYESNGTLDHLFGTDGKVVTFGPIADANAVAIQPTGKIIAAGNGHESKSYGAGLVKYNADGSLDTYFGTGGYTYTPTSAQGGQADAVSLQSDGKIVVLASGENSSTGNEYALYRFLNNDHLTFTVTRNDDRNAACEPGDCSMREAINAANASPDDDTINFALGLTTITLRDEIVIYGLGNLSIQGPGANALTIDGGRGTNRIFFINNPGMDISGLTLTGGNGTGTYHSGLGGAICAFGSLNLYGMNVMGNRAERGGGIYWEVGLANDSLVIDHTTISGNTGQSGGGLFWLSSLTAGAASLAVANSTISSNASSGPGGGIVAGTYGETSSATLINVTINNNYAAEAGGFGGSFLDLSLGNTIVAGNFVTNGNKEMSCYSCSSSSGGGNLFGSAPGDSADIPIEYQPTDLRDTDPLLGPVQNNGGTTPTQALLPGSPLIDRGLNGFIDQSSPAFDQRGTGYPRIRDGNNDGVATVDIGAFEVQPRAPSARTPFDFDGDGRTDLSVFRPSSGTWYINRSQAGFTATQFGLATDKLVPADYDGDGKTDVAVYRPSESVWYVANSSNGTLSTYRFGISTDIPTPADFDGDGHADIAVFRPADGTWWINRSTAGLTGISWGLNGDVPVVGDYDGDGKADIAVYRPAAGVWYILRSTGGTNTVSWGISTDRVVPADYDGDGKTDLAIYRPAAGQWHILNSSNGTYFAWQFGNATDLPTPGDYDGDGRADFAIFRPSDGNWWIRRSSSTATTVQTFGLNGDRPGPNAFVY